jgi:predicted DNA-binding ribbon-helix-helix protein
MPDTKGKRVVFDLETWHALDQLARGRMMTFQELADEAFRDLMKKHNLPLDLRDAFRRSATIAKINDNVAAKPPKPLAPHGKQARKSKRPAGRGRARS